MRRTWVRTGGTAAAAGAPGAAAVAGGCAAGIAVPVAGAVVGGAPVAGAGGGVVAGGVVAGGVVADAVAAGGVAGGGAAVPVGAGVAWRCRLRRSGRRKRRGRRRRGSRGSGGGTAGFTGVFTGSGLSLAGVRSSSNVTGVPGSGLLSRCGLLPLFEHGPHADLADQVLVGHHLARGRLSIGTDRHRVDLDAIELETPRAVLIPCGQDETKVDRVADAARHRLEDGSRHEVQRRERRALLSAGRDDTDEREQRQALRPPPADHQRT